MNETKPQPAAATQPGTAVSVAPAAAGKVLDAILRKPGPRGNVSTTVQNKRRAIGRGICRPSESVIQCLQSNGCVDEYIAALRSLLDPGETIEPIADLAQHITRDTREIAEPFEELFRGRATSRDYATITRVSQQLDDECEELHAAAASKIYVEPVRRSA